MKWKIDSGERDWRRWFAWYPVEIGDEARGLRRAGVRVWWQWVERRTDNVQGYLIHDYRELEKSDV